MLTRYGKLFLPYVEESLKVLEEGVQRTRELNGSKEGIIHLAYIYTMGSNFTPKMVRNFLDTYPDYHIDFHFTVEMCIRDRCIWHAVLQVLHPVSDK